jgi:hypothetical protein
MKPQKYSQKVNIERGEQGSSSNFVFYKKGGNETLVTGCPKL